MVPNIFGNVLSEYKPHEGETQRDCHRRVLVKMMHEKIGMQYLTYNNYVLILWFFSSVFSRERIGIIHIPVETIFGHCI